MALPMPQASPDAGAMGPQMDPVTLAFTGDVDCSTGELRGELRGAYYSVALCDLGTVESWYSIKGAITGTFNPETGSFELGVIDLQEPPALLEAIGLSPRTGGEGTWSATLDPDAPRPELVDDCLDGAEWTDFELRPR